MNTSVQIPEEVVRRFAYKKKARIRDAKALFANLSSFLDQAYQEASTPTSEIDDAWHEFILHTKEYIRYCETRYGRLIHHVPTSPISCESDSHEEEDKEAGYSARQPPLVTGSSKCQSCSSDCRSCQSD